MRHRRNVTKLNRTESHRKALLKNLVSQLFVHERLRTTEVKAKAVRPFAERLITMAKNNTVQSRRNVSKHLSDKAIVKKLFDELSPRFKDRPGGYTRIMKLSNRQGDNARMSIIELVERGTTPKPSLAESSDATEGGKKGKGRKLTGKRKGREKKESGD